MILVTAPTLISLARHKTEVFTWFTVNISHSVQLYIRWSLQASVSSRTSLRLAEYCLQRQQHLKGWGSPRTYRTFFFLLCPSGIHLVYPCLGLGDMIRSQPAVKWQHARQIYFLQPFWGSCYQNNFKLQCVVACPPCGQHWLVSVWHNRALIQFISLWPDRRRITIPIKLSLPEAAHKIMREGGLVEVCSVLLHTCKLALKQVKQMGGWCVSHFCISWKGCCIAKPKPDHQSFQKKNSLNHLTIHCYSWDSFLSAKNQTRMRGRTYRYWGIRSFFLVWQGTCKRFWVSTKHGGAEGRWRFSEKTGISFSLLLFTLLSKKKKKPQKKQQKPCMSDRVRKSFFRCQSKRLRIRGSLGLLMNG